MSDCVTRFAPSPTGYLHLGHAYSAHFAYQKAKARGGRFILRIEDIDPVRCKPEYTPAIIEDLRWLGLEWEEGVRLQSEHIDDYTKALGQLRDMGLIYPCFCSRKDILDEIARSGHAPHLLGVGADDPVYPEICKNLSEDEIAEKSKTLSPAYRLNMRAACARVGSLSWHDRAAGDIAAIPEVFGDIVLARKDVPTSYHLSVVVDDHLQGVTLVTRGMDLFRATSVHRLLQALLGYETPDYHHHELMKDETGRRYAKRDHAVTLRSLRESGVKPHEILAKWGG